METFKAFRSNISPISEALEFDASNRGGPKLRTSLSPNSWASGAARLWNKTSLEFRTKKLTINAAKAESRKVVEKLPI